MNFTIAASKWTDRSTVLYADYKYGDFTAHGSKFYNLIWFLYLLPDDSHLLLTFISLKLSMIYWRDDPNARQNFFEK